MRSLLAAECMLIKWTTAQSLALYSQSYCYLIEPESIGRGNPNLLLILTREIKKGLVSLPSGRGYVQSFQFGAIALRTRSRDRYFVSNFYSRNPSEDLATIASTICYNLLFYYNKKKTRTSGMTLTQANASSGDPFYGL